MISSTSSLLLVLLLSSSLPTTTFSQDYDPICPESFSGYASGPECKSYFICTEGNVVSPITECMHGTIFNEFLSVCDFASNFECGSTYKPSTRPTKRPTVSPTGKLMPTTPHPTLPPNTRSPSANVGVEDALGHAKRDIDGKIFVYQSGWSDLIPSTIYRFDGFLRGLQLMYLGGVGDMTFYLGEDVSGVEGTKVGLVNIAAFLAQSMKETIKYNACDENNWDVIDGVYPLSNACGQLEQSYQDYKCPEGQEHMQCEEDPNMEQKASTQANWYGAPGPLFCGPKSKYPFVGYWDYNHMCDFPWKDPPELCMDYPGQKGGQAVNDAPVENRNNRTDVEGCCWWGRGVIQTTGICNFGMLNYYLGKKAADEGRDSRYPDIDFCKDPGAVCSRDDHPELKWIAGMFYWIRSLQTYDDGWNYVDNLKSYVQGGMKDDSFIDAVSGIVNRGCHNPPCGTGPLDGAYERKENFKKVLEVLLEPDGSPRIQRANDSPTNVPTYAYETYSPTEPKNSEPDPTPPTPPPVTSSNLEGSETLVTDEWSDNEEVAAVREDEDEDWSDTGSSSTMNLWCGETQPGAFENCGRNGYDCLDGVCHNGLKCFMTPACDDEEEEEEAAPPPSPTTKPTPKPVEQVTLPPTPKPVPATEETPARNNVGLRAQFCSRSLAALDTECFTAKTCEKSEDCSQGTYCWGERMCGATESPTPGPVQASNPIPTYSPTEPWNTYSPTATPKANNEMPNNEQPQPQPTATDDTSSSLQFDVSDTFFCGTDRAHASTSCHKRCRSGSHDECDGGETCFGYTACEAEIPRAPSTSAPITKEPTPKPTVPAPKEEANDDVSTPAEQQLFCGSSMEELELSCATAQSCMSGPCPSGSFCFPFTCEAAASATDDKPASPAENQQQPAPVENQQQQPAPAPAEPQPTPVENQGLCPQSTFVGWHTTQDCTEYFECDNGAMGIVHVCDESLKFDKVRNVCHPAEYVNSFCYGPPLGKEEADPMSASRGLCNEGYTGWGSRLECKEYYWCSRGIADAIYDCGQDLLFDGTLELCTFAHLVHCNSNRGGVPVPTPPPTALPSSNPTPVPVTFPPTASESPSIVGGGSTGEGTTPSWGGGTSGGVVGDYSWSDTAIPTVPQNASEIPPWLMNTVMARNSGDTTSSSNTQLLWLLIAFIPIQMFILW